MEKRFNSYLAGWIACVWLGMLQFGYMMGEFTLISDILPWIYNFENIKGNSVVSILATAGPIGAFFGAIAAGPMSYRGRRFWFFVANSLIIFAVCLRMISDLYASLLARVFFGFAVGIFSTIVPLFVIEISPIKLKGTNGTFIQLAVTTGILLSYIMGSTSPSYDPPSNYYSNSNYCHDYKKKNHEWRLILAFPIILSLIQILLLIFVFKHDTPKYYWIIQNFEKAKIVLMKIHMNTLVFNNPESLTTTQDGMSLDVMEYIDTNPDGRTFQSLGKRKYRRAFLVGVMLWIIQQMSGINLLIFYVNKVVNNTQGLTFLVGGINFGATVISIFVIPKYRRKSLMLIGMLVMWQCYALMFSIYPEILSAVEHDDDEYNRYVMLFAVIISFFVLGYAITIGPLPWMYLPEIMTEIGMGIAVSINWLIVILISYLPSIAHNVKSMDSDKKSQPDMAPFFFVFGGWCI